MAALIFRRGRDDALVTMLEAGAVALAALFVIIQVRLAFGSGDLDHRLTFDELTILMLTAAAQAFAYHWIAKWSGRAAARVARGLLGSAAYMIAVGLAVFNPLVTGLSAKALALVLAYLVPACAALYAGYLVHDATFRRFLLGYALAAGLLWATLQVRFFSIPKPWALATRR